MICAKNYETASKIVKVMPRILLASFFYWTVTTIDVNDDDCAANVCCIVCV